MSLTLTLTYDLSTHDLSTHDLSTLTYFKFLFQNFRGNIFFFLQQLKFQNIVQTLSRIQKITLLKLFQHSVRNNHNQQKTNNITTLTFRNFIKTHLRFLHIINNNYYYILYQTISFFSLNFVTIKSIGVYISSDFPQVIS